MTATIDDTTRRFVSIGTVARLVGKSPTTLRELESRGVLPAAARVEGLDRRLYSLADVEVIRAALAERDAARLARGAA